MRVGRSAGWSLAALVVVAAVLLVLLVALGRTTPSFDAQPAARTLPPIAPAATELTADPDGPAAATGADPKPSPAWTARVAAATGVPVRALQAYAAAQLVLAAEDPGCALGWNTVAGIGAVESDHGRHDGSAIDADGIDRPAVLGPPLDGTAGNKALPDTDGGRLDGDPVWDRAVGPFQFIPETWEQWGRSASGGGPDPNDIDDAALTAAWYLCASGADMSTASGWNAAVATYDEPVAYAVDVAAFANEYADRSAS